MKQKAFRKLLLTIQNLEMNDQRDELQKEFIEWKGEHEQVDDVCVIGVRV